MLAPTTRLKNYRRADAPLPPPLGEVAERKRGRREFCPYDRTLPQLRYKLRWDCRRQSLIIIRCAMLSSPAGTAPLLSASRTFSPPTGKSTLREGAKVASVPLCRGDHRSSVLQRNIVETDEHCSPLQVCCAALPPLCTREALFVLAIRRLVCYDEQKWRIMRIFAERRVKYGRTETLC